MKRILVPIDFSKNSFKAARVAIKMTTLNGAEVRFVHVSGVLIPTGPIPGGIEVSTPEYHLQMRTKDLEKAINRLYSLLKIERRPKRSSCLAADHAVITDGIIEEARNFKADLIVMGTCGASGFKEMFLGSNTTIVLENADCPVLAVPEKYNFRGVKKIAFATELIDTKRELKKVVPFAELFKANIEIFHTYPNFPEKVDMDSFDADKFEADLKKSNKFDFLELSLIKTERSNDVKGGTDAFLKRIRPQLLVMFFTKRNWFDKLTEGSKTKKMVFHSRIPVLSFRREKAIAKI